MLKLLKWSKDNQKLILILILYLVFAVTYSIVVPIGRGADEWAHYWYAEFIAQNGRLPANPAERETAGYKADWPPLYHFFAAGLTAWIETNGPPTFKYRADNIRRQLVPALGPEAILHTQDERFPWQQEILIWHVGRFLSIIFAIGTLLVTYFIALEIFAGGKEAGEQHTTPNTHHQNQSQKFPITNRQLLITSPKIFALIAVAVIAFIPRFLFTGMLFNYDSLTLLLASLFLWLTIRIVKGYHIQWGSWGLGLLAGLALITKYLAAPLLVVIGVLVWYMAGSKGAREQRSKGAEERHIAHISFLTFHIPHLISRFFSPFATPRLWVHLGQAILAFLLVTSWWFTYLIITFNEIETYGPVLGTLAPLIRGDGSDRTVEAIFSFLSGDQSPPPAYIERQAYTAWQIITELPTTLWGNPITVPYPLNWFVWTMSIVVMIAAIGVGLCWRNDRDSRIWINLLLLQCVLPLPFMFIRLFGARDALEAVQGRHILFLAGPAISILLVWGILSITNTQFLINRQHSSRIVFYVLIGLLLTGAIHQLIFMWRTYPPLLPVRTDPLLQVQMEDVSLDDITLEGGASLIGYRLSGSPNQDKALQVTLIWQAGTDSAPEDYQVELALVDEQQQIQSSWLAYQTQARYPTRTWEAGDTIFDEGWLPLAGLATGRYEIRLRILSKAGSVIDWRTLTPYILIGPTKQRNGEDRWVLWHNGQIARRLPILHERETAQFTIPNPKSQTSNPQLIGPDGILRTPVSANSRWANFIVGPGWPAGDYYAGWESDGLPVLRVVDRGRNFVVPEIARPLEANFERQIKLLGYHLFSRRAEPGDGLPITLYWQGLEWMGEEFVIFNRLLDNNQVVWGGYDRLAQENYSTLLWAPGEIIIDGFAVPIEPDAPEGVYMLNLGWYRQVEGEAESLHILNPETNELTESTSVTIGPIKVGGPPVDVAVEQATPQTKVNIRLGEKIELLGFDINNQVHDGLDRDEFLLNTTPLDLTFYWQVLAQMDIDYTVFAHVRDTDGELVAQIDRPPLNGAYPTSLWDPGEIIKDDLTIPLGDVEPGEYQLVIGMYDFTTGVRLSVTGSLDGTIVLQKFRVGE